MYSLSVHMLASRRTGQDLLGPTEFLNVVSWSLVRLVTKPEARMPKPQAEVAQATNKHKKHKAQSRRCEMPISDFRLFRSGFLIFFSFSLAYSPPPVARGTRGSKALARSASRAFLCALRQKKPAGSWWYPAG
jgi:hypothetical protein